MITNRSNDWKEANRIYEGLDPSKTIDAKVLDIWQQVQEKKAEVYPVRQDRTNTVVAYVATSGERVGSCFSYSEKVQTSPDLWALVSTPRGREKLALYMSLPLA